MAPNREKISHHNEPSFCRYCGSPIYIEADPDAIGAGPIQRRVYTLLRRRPMTKEELFHALYGQDDSGGPNPKVIDVVINQLNRSLLPHGLVARRQRPGVMHSPYALMDLATAPPGVKGPRPRIPVDKPVDK